MAVLPDGPPNERAANSFMHCVESSTSSCIQTGETEKGGWDAFHLLTWMAEGSPVAILESLQSELSGHRDPRYVQERFVAEVERYSAALRGAQCEATDSKDIGPLIDKAGQMAATRMNDLGLWQRNMDKVIEGLVEEAHRDLDGGSLVRLDCTYDPFQVYLATEQHDGQFQVVGMTTLLSPDLGGALPSRDMVDERLHSRSLGLDTAQASIVEDEINHWLPFPMEVF